MAVTITFVGYDDVPVGDGTQKLRIPWGKVDGGNISSGWIDVSRASISGGVEASVLAARIDGNIRYINNTYITGTTLQINTQRYNEDYSPASKFIYDAPWGNRLFNISSGSGNDWVSFPLVLFDDYGNYSMGYCCIYTRWGDARNAFNDHCSVTYPTGAGVNNAGYIIVDSSYWLDTRASAEISSYGAEYSTNAKFLAWITNTKPYIPTGDPFQPGGESDVGGGTGDFDGTSTPVGFASLPSISSVDTGFIGLYNPTLTDLQNLANYLWSPLFDVTTLKKLFTDPMECILGLSIIPGPVPSGTSRNVIFGNIDTEISMPVVSSQYFNVDCGSLNVSEYWGAYLDYEPYTKAEIYLPFIGIHQIAVDEIMDKNVAIIYHVDALSGACCCEIKCGDSVLYTFVGSCSTPVPVTSKDWAPMITGIITMAASVGSMVASGGKTAPSAGSNLASAAVNNLKPSIEKSGAIGGGGGLLAGMKPVLILTRPRQALPVRQHVYTGYPSFITKTLADISGYTEVHSIRLSGIDGTDSELSEIEELLKGGVIF